MMSELSDTTPLQNNEVQCPVCSTHSSRGAVTCIQCGSRLEPLQPDELIITRPLHRVPVLSPVTRGHTGSLEAHTTVILQFLPSGTCITTQLDKPLMLGRKDANDGSRFVNLNDFNGKNHGVSRQHCLLQRQNTDLSATDLGSTNGTYLNGQRLVPRQPYIVTQGDKLILGSLHVIVSFAK